MDPLGDLLGGPLWGAPWEIPLGDSPRETPLAGGSAVADARARAARVAPGFPPKSPWGIPLGPGVPWGHIWGGG